MRHRPRTLLSHPVVKSLLFERLLLVGSFVLAFAAVAMGRVRPSEITDVLDTRLLTLFFVLTIAVELGKASDLFDRLVVAVVRRVHSARGLALGMILVTGVLAAILTNDVALFLVVPFTMLFRRITDLDLGPIVILEIFSANLIGSLTPLGNPQNLFLYARGHFTLTSFLAHQAPWVGAAAILLALVVVWIVPRWSLGRPPEVSFDVQPVQAAACLVLLAAQLAALLGAIHHWIPLVLSIGGIALLGRKVREADFSLVLAFAFLFIGVAGIERGPLYRELSPERLFGSHARGLVLSGALLSQFISNLPAAMLLAPTTSSAAGFGALLYGVNAGGCGTPIASLANLIGAQLYAREGGDPKALWRRFLPVSFALLAGMTLVSLLLV